MLYSYLKNTKIKIFKSFIKIKKNWDDLMIGERRSITLYVSAEFVAEYLYLKGRVIILYLNVRKY